MKRLMRIGAVSAALGGGLRLVAQAIPYVPDSAALEALYAVIDVGFLFALIALIACVSERISIVGLGSMLIATAGVASIVGPDRTAFGMDFYLLGSAIFVLALGASAIWLIRLNGYRRPSIAFAMAAMFAIAAGISGAGMAFIGAGLTLAASFLLLAQALWLDSCSPDR